MKYNLNCFVSLGALMLLCSCSPVTMTQYMKNGQQPLSTEQLHRFLEGQNLQLEAIDFQANVHYKAGGQIYAKSLQGKTDSGTWTITPENQLCMTFRRWYYGDQNCYTVFKDGNNYTFFTANGARYYSGVHAGNRTLAISDTAPGAKNHEYTEKQPNQLTALTPLNSKEKHRFLYTLAQDCPDCNFADASFKGAQLTGANLAGANLSGADLSEANLSRAHLSGANLEGANLSNCNLQGADLKGSNLLSAELTGAIFTGANLTDAQIDNIQDIVR